MVSRAKSHQPCAACKRPRRRCDSDCLLAPYFPKDEMEKFACVHMVFGTSNVIKMIKMVEETKRDDAVEAIVYEATARMRDPVYGSAGSISHLYKMVEELKAQLESIETRVLELKKQRNQLLSILTNVRHPDPVYPLNDFMFAYADLSLDDGNLAYDPVKFAVECEWIL